MSKVECSELYWKKKKTMLYKCSQNTESYMTIYKVVKNQAEADF